MKLLKMQNVYKFVCTLFLIGISISVSAQYPVKYDVENHLLQNLNFFAREGGEDLNQRQSTKIKNNLDEMNKDIAKVILAKNMVSEGLLNVNSALKNSLAVKDMIRILEDITSNANALMQIQMKNPLYARLARKYVTDAVHQAISLHDEISKIALSNRNIAMNWQYRDGIIREVYVRLRLINSDLTLAKRSIEMAMRVGFWRGATPFGNWVNTDKRIALGIINRIKHL